MTTGLMKNTVPTRQYTARPTNDVSAEGLSRLGRRSWWRLAGRRASGGHPGG
jgi:hypothetical protein